MPEGFVVGPMGLAVWSLDLLESGLFRVPEGFAVEPLGLAVVPLGILVSEFSRMPEGFAVEPLGLAVGPLGHLFSELSMSECDSSLCFSGFPPVILFAVEAFVFPVAVRVPVFPSRVGVVVVSPVPPST